MNRKEIIYLSVMGVAIVLYLGLQIFGPKPIDWSESYSSLDKIPYGGYILKQELPVLSPSDQVEINHKPLFQSLNDEFRSLEAELNWIFINSRIGFDPFETDLLLQRVNEGDQVFIAASEFSSKFADTLNLETDYEYSPWDSSITNFEVQSPEDFSLSFSNPALDSTKKWTYPKLLRRYFSSFDSTSTTILGTDNASAVNFIKISFGDGAFFLHSNPAVFTNYFLRDVEYADYAFKALSYLPPENRIVWDEHYKIGRRYEDSPIKYVLANADLKMGWYLAIVGIILFMIFRGKRKQRIIPIIKPPVNSSIEFAKTIGDLYLEKGNHHTIALKRIDFFLEYIRSNLGLETYKVDDQFISDVSRRSGIEESEIDKLFSLIADIRQNDKIDTSSLKLLTNRIDWFYNQSKR